MFVALLLLFSFCWADVAAAAVVVVARCVRWCSQTRRYQDMASVVGMADVAVPPPLLCCDRCGAAFDDDALTMRLDRHTTVVVVEFAVRGHAKYERDRHAGTERHTLAVAGENRVLIIIMHSTFRLVTKECARALHEAVDPPE